MRGMLRTIVFGLLLIMASVHVAGAEEQKAKIVTISVQKVLFTSEAGKEAKKVMDAKMSDLQHGIKPEQDALERLKQEIETKKSVWSEDVQAEKEREYQKRFRELKIKADDAKYAIGKLEKDLMEPILKELHQVIAEVGEKNGFALIFEYTRQGLQSPTGLLYASPSMDISDMVLTMLNEKLSKKGSSGKK